jgi:hypothetical protein
MRILDVSTAARSLSFARGLRKTGKTPIWLELDGETPAIWMARSQVGLHIGLIYRFMNSLTVAGVGRMEPMMERV